MKKIILYVISLLLITCPLYAACGSPTANNGACTASGYANTIIPKACCTGAGTGTCNQRVAASSASADVKACTDISADGDTVIVPDGDSTWSSGMSIATGMTVKTQYNVDHPLAVPDCVNGTIIRITGSSGTMFSLPTVAGKYYEFAGFCFLDGAGYTYSTSNVGTFYITGNTKTLRLHHNRWNMHSRSGSFYGDVYAVVDSSSFINTAAQSFYLSHGTWGGVAENGHNSWADDEYFGTNKFIFLENNTFDSQSVSMGAFGPFDGSMGFRAVGRYNTIYNTRFTGHGLDTGGGERSVRAIELYNNLYVHNKSGNTSEGIGDFRGGNGLIHHNAITNTLGTYSAVVILNNYRSGNDNSKAHYCNGTNVWDDNDDAHNPYYTGTVSGTSSYNSSTQRLTITVVGTTGWTDNQWVGYSIKKSSSSTGASSYIASNTTTGGVTTIQYWQNNQYPDAGNMTFTDGQEFTINKPLQCMDQPGMGKGLLVRSQGNDPFGYYLSITGLPPTGVAGHSPDDRWVGQATVPWYSWANAPAITFNSTWNNTVISGTHYHNNTEPTGYVPYTCPHPLVTELSGKTCGSGAGQNYYGIDSVIPTYNISVTQPFYGNVSGGMLAQAGDTISPVYTPPASGAAKMGSWGGTCGCTGTSNSCTPFAASADCTITVAETIQSYPSWVH